MSKFTCKFCNFNGNSKSAWVNHVKTKKHQNMLDAKLELRDIICPYCRAVQRDKKIFEKHVEVCRIKAQKELGLLGESSEYDSEPDLDDSEDFDSDSSTETEQYNNDVEIKNNNQQKDYESDTSSINSEDLNFSLREIDDQPMSKTHAAEMARKLHRIMEKLKIKRLQERIKDVAPEDLIYTSEDEMDPDKVYYTRNPKVKIVKL
uniref:Uncharacterized protein n=1 Tax=viral metagenome TaxID=1070528 RepID=A0A6C0E939_9ZZZZ